ncbi:MAG TPA: hypothetical protein VMR31_04165 [Myxococcota bacterium]|nr:hypothetical protein [Myxococcota bacterium]
MTRSLALAAVLVLACGRGEPPSLGIGARVTLDRSETRVGDPVGVTVEIETPPGYSVQAPPPPAGGPFASESLQLVPPIEVPGGLRHHVLWIVRAREVGDQALPWLDVPLVRPDGSVQPLHVGGVPLEVRSVKAELPERAAVFDIRMAPPQKPLPLWVWLAGAALLALGWAGARAVRARARAVELRAAQLAAAGRAALDALDGVEREPDARKRAARVRAALLGFVAGRWRIETHAATPAELPADVDGEIVRILAGLDAARFGAAPVAGAIAGLAERARERVRHVAELRA